MKRTASLVALVTLFAMGVYFLAPGASEGRAGSDRTTSEAGAHPGEPSRDVAQTLSDQSVYHLSSVWKNQRHEAVEWSSLQGRPQLVAFFYTHCGFTCPRIVHDLKGVLSELPGSERRTVGVVLVSIDPEHDTPDALRAFSEMHGLAETQWTLLTGEDRDVRELAAALHVRYQEQPGGDFAHSNAIILLDAGGEIIARSNGLATNHNDLVTALNGVPRDIHHNE